MGELLRKTSENLKVLSWYFSRLATYWSRKDYLLFLHCLLDPRHVLNLWEMGKKLCFLPGNPNHVILRVPLGSVVPKLPLLYVHRANLMAHRMEMGWRRPPELIVYRQGTKFVHVGDSEVLAAYKMALAPSQMVNVRVLRWGYKNPFDPHSREGKFWIGGFESSSPKPPESVPESMLPIWKDGWAAAVEQRDGHFQHREGKNVRTQ